MHVNEAKFELNRVVDVSSNLSVKKAITPMTCFSPFIYSPFIPGITFSLRSVEFSDGMST